ncbi:hypothetical protein A8C56_23215 [Niabella ginsenosidivorans]|uniref:Uncharacterized protein n=1 Tax=Niabella ginsenosidivorans TaxID=1176587 RepID=A0A1A9I9C7_9BACT|nr:STM3941 family protein [Niabella ginsenosidivorans]ANH84173.1 hypothetical protein A8C56_23215 [Niabella ginsenosidivorans]
MQPVFIPVSKRKSLRNLAGAILLVVLGVLFIIKPYLFIKSDDPAVIRIIGYICVAFFGICAIAIGRMLANKKDGIWISHEGVNDQSSGIAAGKILWKDVKSIRVESVPGQRFILLEVYNPEEYIRQQHNPLKKQAMGMNYQLYKTPVCITANFITIEFEKLLELLQAGFHQAERE